MSIASNLNETIIAQATPCGYGGVSIVRISGLLVPSMIQPILNIRTLTPRQATLLSFYSLNHHVIDQGLALFFPLPHSFTGEDILELHCHGGPIIVDLLLQHALYLGARLAHPGEFSKRAFLNNKMDLTQAEAIADLIQAHSIDAAKLAMRSLQGEFSKIVRTLAHKIIELRVQIEAMLNFSNEADIHSPLQSSQALHSIIQQLNTLKEQAREGNRLQEGITIVISGPPNVGKSSLLNYFSGEEVAIVTSIEGTTRDTLRQNVTIDGLAIQLIDTAGLRHSHDTIEQEGIRRAKVEIQKADIILYLFDAQQFTASTLTDAFDIFREKTSAQIIFIRNKIDLTQEQPMIVFQPKSQFATSPILNVSIQEKIGLDLLKKAIKQYAHTKNSPEGLFLARRRHLEALNKVQNYLYAALDYIKRMDTVDELVAEELSQAQSALNEITGEFSSDDLLGQIFSTFCIGK